MTKKKKNPESSVTSDIIKKVHVSLADLKSGEEIITFLHESEPVFMREVTRFARIEMERLNGVLPFPQVVFLGSVVGAAYICGYLIAKETHASMFDELIKIDGPLSKCLSPREIDRLIDNGLAEGKTYSTISENINKILKIGNTKDKKKPTKKRKKKTDNGKRLDIGDMK